MRKMGFLGNGEYPNYENGEYPNYENGEYPNYENGEYPNYENWKCWRALAILKRSDESE